MISEKTILAYIYQLTKFGGLMACGSKDILYSKMHPVSCTNIDQDRHRFGKLLNG